MLTIQFLRRLAVISHPEARHFAGKFQIEWQFELREESGTRRQPHLMSVCWWHCGIRRLPRGLGHLDVKGESNSAFLFAYSHLLWVKCKTVHLPVRDGGITSRRFSDTAINQTQLSTMAKELAQCWRNSKQIDRDADVGDCINENATVALVTVQSAMIGGRLEISHFRQDIDGAGRCCAALAFQQKGMSGRHSVAPQRKSWRTEGIGSVQSASAESYRTKRDSGIA